MSIRLFYDRWPQYNRRISEIVGPMTDEQLGIRPSPEHLPIWAIVAHMAGVRVYWLCHVLGELGAASTPWADPEAEGWEDDLDRPRTAAELVAALDATWAIVDGCLDRWTPEMLGHEFERFYGEQRQLHTRTSVLQRLLSHDAYHVGQVNQTLGIHQLPEIYIWRPD